MTRPLLAVSLLTPLLLAPGLAGADSQGTPGRVVEVRVNGSGSDDQALFRGQVTVQSGKKDGGTAAIYKWGGTTCPGKDLTADQVALLADALANRGRVSIVPRFKNGQGGNLCLVSFSLASHKEAGTLGQPDPT